MVGIVFSRMQQWQVDIKYEKKQDSENSENEKKDLCGQLRLVDTKSILKVKKTADFNGNQPFLMVRATGFEPAASSSQS